jgi:hypothetical protein
MDQVNFKILMLFILAIVAGWVFVSTDAYPMLIMAGVVLIYAVGHLSHLLYELLNRHRP